jgi:hypothetical protein
LLQQAGSGVDLPFARRNKAAAGKAILLIFAKVIFCIFRN